MATQASAPQAIDSPDENACEALKISELFSETQALINFRDLVATSPEEALLVLRAQSGDREALELLIRGVEPMVRRCVVRLVTREIVDDVVQNVLVAVCRKLSSLSEPEFFRTWIYRITTRAAFGFLRKEKRWAHQLRDEGLLTDVQAPEFVPSSQVFEQILSMESIPAASRAVLVLHYQEDLSLPEVAAILAIPLGTVKSRLAAGLAAVRRNFHRNGEHHVGTK